MYSFETVAAMKELIMMNDGVVHSVHHFEGDIKKVDLYQTDVDVAMFIQYAESKDELDYINFDKTGVTFHDLFQKYADGKGIGELTFALQ